MTFLLLSAFVVLTTAAPRLAPLRPALITEAESRIVGGSEATPGQFPFQGSLLSSTSPSGSHTCGAVLISSNWVLNAAHCTQTAFRSVWFGLHRRSQTSDGQHRTFTRIVNHPYYGEGSGAYPNDISVLELSSPIISGGNIEYATLARSGDFAGETVTISGWGRNCSTCAHFDELMYVNIGALSNPECTAYWDSYINEGHICVYSGSTGSCSGDSGGPMSINNTVIGIASWGAAGCSTNWPSVYTRVTYFRDWIEEVTGV